MTSSGTGDSPFAMLRDRPRNPWGGPRPALEEHAIGSLAVSASVLLARPDRLERLLEVPVMTIEIVGLRAGNRRRRPRPAPTR